MDPVTGRFFPDEGRDATTVISVVELEDEPLVQSKVKKYNLTSPFSNSHDDYQKVKTKICLSNSKLEIFKGQWNKPGLRAVSFSVPSLLPCR